MLQRNTTVIADSAGVTSHVKENTLFVDLHLESVSLTEPMGQTIELDRHHLKRYDKIRVTARPTSTAKLLASPEYVAATRRKRVKTIRDSVLGLSQHENETLFVAYTQQVLHDIRVLITDLTESDRNRARATEGNTREVLRQVRDSLQGTGWKRLIEPEVRQELAAILGFMTKSEVTPVEIAASRSRLKQLKMTPYVIPMVIPDGDQEI
jgi:hypothetical protein